MIVVMDILALAMGIAAFAILLGLIFAIDRMFRSSRLRNGF